MNHSGPIRNAMLAETRRHFFERCAVGVGQIALAGLLSRVLQCLRPTRLRRTVNRRLRRNEEARLYHWRRHKRLPPRRLEQRT